MTLPNARDCVHGHLRRKCDECHLLAVAKECVGWDATPEQALLEMRATLERYKLQHEYDIGCKDQLRAEIAKLLGIGCPGVNCPTCEGRHG